MSLMSFHRFLISTSVIFCLGFALWELAQFRAEGSILALIVGIAFGVAGFCLVYYVSNLERFLGLSTHDTGSDERRFSPNGHRAMH